MYIHQDIQMHQFI